MNEQLPSEDGKMRGPSQKSEGCDVVMVLHSKQVMDCQDSVWKVNQDASQDSQQNRAEGNPMPEGGPH